MGLDVYLYKYDRPYAEVKAEEEACSAATEAIWEREAKGREFNAIPEEERDRISALCRAEEKRRGMGEYGESPAKTKIEEPSKVYPDHYFKVGYMRSSYNAGGIDRVLATVLGEGNRLSDIFGAPDNGDDFAPNWKACLKRARKVRDAFAKACAGPVYSAEEHSHNPFMSGQEYKSTDEASAIAVFETERKRWLKAKADAEADPKLHPPFENFSNREGTFYMKEPRKVLAVIEGTTEMIGRTRPATYLITEVEDRHEWYRHALEIVVEMIEWVLGKPDPESYVLHWSG